MSDVSAICKITDTELFLYGQLIGESPTSEDILNSIPNKPDRRFLLRDSTRELILFDPIGISALLDRETNLVIALGFDFEPPRSRPRHEKDPTGYFDGTLQIGRFIFKPPVGRTLAEKVSAQRFCGFSFFFVYDTRGATSLTIGFSTNEKRIKAMIERET